MHNEMFIDKFINSIQCNCGVWPTFKPWYFMVCVLVVVHPVSRLLFLCASLVMLGYRLLGIECIKCSRFSVILPCVVYGRVYS